MVPGSAAHVLITVKISMAQNVQTGPILVAGHQGQGILKFLPKTDVHHAGVQGFPPHTDIEPAWSRKRTGGTGRKHEAFGDRKHILPLDEFSCRTTARAKYPG